MDHVTLCSPNMYFQSAELAKVDTELRDTVFGYIKNLQKSLTNKILNNVTPSINSRSKWII